MLYKKILLILLCCLAIEANAQFYVNMEGGLKWDVVQTFSSKGYFFYENKPDFMGGAVFGYEVNPYLFLETGVHVHQLNNNYVYKLDGVDWLTQERWLPAQFIQVPLRLRTTVATIKENLSFHPYVGLNILLHRHEDGRYESREYQRPIEDPTFQSSFKYEYNAGFRERYLLLLEAGITARYKITRHFSILCSLGFMMGSTAIHESIVAWERRTPAIKDSGVTHAQYKGDQISLMIGVQCRFMD